MNQVIQKPSFRDVAIADHGGGGKLMPQTFGDVVSFSEIMARAQHAIPKHLRDVPGACLAVTMQALRWEMDPFAVASKSYNVKDIISYEAQLIAAVVHTRAPLKTRPNYTYTGDGQDRRCTVSALFDDGIERSYESPRIADIAVKNSPLWKADPDQQLGYFSIRSFARRYCPEVILGVYTPEEAENFRGPDNARDVTPRASLSERLAANAPAATGFNENHTVAEIDGQPAGGASTQTEHEQETEVAETMTTQAGAAQAGQEGEMPSSDFNSTQLETQSTPESKPEPSGDASAPSPALPVGWAAVYAAALKRAQKPTSLDKLAAEFWKDKGGWKAHAKGENGELASAIFKVFTDHFGDKDTIEAQLRELIG